MTGFNKMRFVTTIEIDEAMWAAEYGIDPTDSLAVRDDVCAYLDNLIQESPAAQARLLRSAVDNVPLLRKRENK